MDRFVVPLFELQIQLKGSGCVSVLRSRYLRMGVSIWVKHFGGGDGAPGIEVFERRSAENEWFERV